MSDLEKYIIENRTNLDLEEPKQGHSGRFQKKLGGNDTKMRKLNIRHALQIAASIAIILASGVVIVKSSKGGGKIAATPQAQEFMEAKTYYTGMVNDKYSELSGFDFSSEQEKDLLLEELKTMDTYYKELQQQLSANPGDERIMSALIQHYQMKLDVMEQIIQQLKQINSIKNNNTNDNENANI